MLLGFLELDRFESSEGFALFLILNATKRFEAVLACYFLVAYWAHE